MMMMMMKVLGTTHSPSHSKPVALQLTERDSCSRRGWGCSGGRTCTKHTLSCLNMELNKSVSEGHEIGPEVEILNNRGVISSVLLSELGFTTQYLT